LYNIFEWLHRDQKLVVDEYYHIYNRGNGKNSIFLDKEDYNRFIKLLYVCNSVKSFNFKSSIVDKKIDAFDFDREEKLVNICAWVLMPNHFHILLIAPRSDLGAEDFNQITEFMRKISTSYVMYFNKKYKRTGGLFEGKFKSKHIAEDNYFRYLFAYIHLNPVKLIQSDWKELGVKNKKITVDYIKNYAYSSFQDFYGSGRKQNKILNKDSLHDGLIIENISDVFKWISPLGPT